MFNKVELKFLKVYNNKMTTQANKDLEKASIRQDEAGVMTALKAGANIGYQGGNCFVTACRIGNVNIVDMIVRNPKFLAQSKICKKKYENSNFEFGFEVACSNNRREVVEYLVASDIYNQAVNIDDLLIKGLEHAAGYIKSNMVDYLINKINPLMKKEFMEMFKADPKKYNEFIRPLILKSKLDDSLDEKQNTRKMKI